MRVVSSFPHDRCFEPSGRRGDERAAARLHRVRWWINRSAAELSLPWHTTLLHHPFGTTLLGHTLNPFNGVMAIGLLKIFTLVQTYNLIVVFSFVMGGVTACWLCRAMTGWIVGSLVGGGVFTFSSFHIAHASSHLQLVALEWIPLFLLCWIRFCKTPTAMKAAAAAGALSLVIPVPLTIVV